MDAENRLEISFTVDWIAATFDEYGGLKFARKLGYKTWASDVEGVPPRGYNTARELETGALIAWHTERKEMGVHVRLSGSVLRHYQTLNADWRVLLAWCKEFKGRTSRVDLAVDVRGSQLKQGHFAKTALRPYKGRGRTPKYLPVGTQEDGWTLYIGSRSSDKFLRIYDKAKEQGDHEGDYIRIELECKGEIAHAVGWEFPTRDTAECVGMAQTLIRTVADFDLPAWDVALSSRDVGLSIPQGKSKDTLGWLTKICAPSLAKMVAKHPNEDILEQFFHAVREEMKHRGLDVW